MKILHVGWGFSPWFGGGLVKYAESLMEMQAENGFEVFYFFVGRHYPIIKKPRLIKWSKGGVVMYEIINATLYNKFRDILNTRLYLNEPCAETFFREVLDSVKPDIINIQALEGLPSSLIDIAIDEYKLPVVMVLHDYFLVCPFLRLFDWQQKNCSDLHIGSKCIDCYTRMSFPFSKKYLRRITLLYELRKLIPSINFIKILYYYLKKKRIVTLRKVNEKEHFKKQLKNIGNEMNAFDFQLRRDINIERLEKIDILIAQSHSVEKIYKRYLTGNNIITLPIAVKHIDCINPKKIDKICLPIKFATLSGCSDVAKGSGLLLDMLKILNSKKLDNYFEIYIWGGLDKCVAKEILEFKKVFYRGPYNVKDLNKILNEIDVGIIPSVWEEPLGFVGLEFLAKGIPIIGNNRGGITDYTINNMTGWINKSSSAEELADIISALIHNPAEIVKMSAKIVENREKIIKNMARHFKEIEDMYTAVIEKKRRF